MMLEEIERIKCLKYRYFRALDRNDWTLMAECFTEDAVARYDSGKYSFDGRENIIRFLDKYMGDPTILTLHQGHHPEIEVQDANNASGIWYLQDMVINLQQNTTLRGAGFYEDLYVKQEGAWRIKQTGYERTYEEVEQRRHTTISHNCFLPAR